MAGRILAGLVTYSAANAEVGQVFNLRADFLIGAGRGLQTRVQDGILPHLEA